MQTASGANRYEPVPIYRTPDASDDLSVSDQGIINLRRRRTVLRELDRISRDIDRTKSMSAIDVFQQRAAAMLSSTKTRDAFNLDLEPESVRRRYGDTHWGKSLLTCRRLVEAGARLSLIHI